MSRDQFEMTVGALLSALRDREVVGFEAGDLNEVESLLQEVVEVCEGRFRDE